MRGGLPGLAAGWACALAALCPAASGQRASVVRCQGTPCTSVLQVSLPVSGSSAYTLPAGAHSPAHPHSLYASAWPHRAPACAGTTVQDQFNQSWALQQALTLSWVLPGAVTVGARRPAAVRRQKRPPRADGPPWRRVPPAVCWQLPERLPGLCGRVPQQRGQRLLQRPDVQPAAQRVRPGQVQPQRALPGLHVHGVGAQRQQRSGDSAGGPLQRERSRRRQRGGHNQPAMRLWCSGLGPEFLCGGRRRRCGPRCLPQWSGQACCRPVRPHCYRALHDVQACSRHSGWAQAGLCLPSTLPRQGTPRPTC